MSHTYRLVCTATAEIEETWTVTSDQPLTADEVEARVFGDDSIEAEVTFVEDRVLGNERDRETTTIEGVEEGEQP